MSQHSHDSSGSNGNSDHGHHFILSNAMAFRVFGTLLVLTVVTVAVAYIDLGPTLNTLLALFVATVKASLVCLFFMGLKYDKKENTVIFVTSLLFVAIFMALTFSDVLFRRKPVVDGPFFKPTQGIAQFKKPWVAQPEILAHGKQLFTAQCISCHGAEGKGDGPAAGALNPKPRNFTGTEGWKNGRKPTDLVGTLTKGLNTMPSFGSLPLEDRWALAHYVASLNPSLLKDSDEDLKKAGIDPTQDNLPGSTEKTLPVDFVIERMATE